MNVTSAANLHQCRLADERMQQRLITAVGCILCHQMLPVYVDVSTFFVLFLALILYTLTDYLTFRLFLLSSWACTLTISQSCAQQRQINMFMNQQLCS